MSAEDEKKRIAETVVVLARHGFACQEIESLSPNASGRKAHRFTLRARLAGGHTIKIRCLETDDEAARLTAIRSRLDPAFTPVIARHGVLLLEPWIDGEELGPQRAAERAEELGAILGRLHATELPDEPACAAPHARRERAADQLTTLGQLGVVSRDVSDTLRGELLRTDPEQTPATVVHLDYCPENLVVDTAGVLHVIDNEWIRIDVPGVDLGRTYSRWPMTEDVWRRFLRGYLTTTPFDPGPLRFWMIVMAAAGATIRLQKSPEELALPVARLHQLAAT